MHCLDWAVLEATPCCKGPPGQAKGFTVPTEMDRDQIDEAQRLAVEQSKAQ